MIAFFSLLLATTPSAAPIPAAEAAEVLRKADIASFAPASFRARLRIDPLREAPEPSDAMDVEVWTSGEAKSLVRFLGPKEQGKYLLRREGTVWFLAPGARKPVKVGAAHRLRGGASLDDILGIRYSRDYLIETAAESQDEHGRLVVLDLAAKDKRAPYPKVRYLVRQATGRPVRAEYRLRSGRTSSVVDFLEWEPGSRPVARKLLLTDQLGSRLKTEVTLLEMEEVTVPEGLFDLEDPAPRKRLEKP